MRKRHNGVGDKQRKKKEIVFVLPCVSFFFVCLIEKNPLGKTKVHVQGESAERGDTQRTRRTTDPCRSVVVGAPRGRHVRRIPESARCNETVVLLYVARVFCSYLIVNWSLSLNLCLSTLVDFILCQSISHSLP